MHQFDGASKAPITGVASKIGRPEAFGGTSQQGTSNVLADAVDEEGRRSVGNEFHV
jgi:hypothetical protein